MWLLGEAMSSALDSEAAFTDRAQQIGLEKWVIDKIKEKKFATFGRLVFGFAYAPADRVGEVGH